MSHIYPKKKRKNRKKENKSPKVPWTTPIQANLFELYLYGPSQNLTWSLSLKGHMTTNNYILKEKNIYGKALASTPLLPPTYITCFMFYASLWVSGRPLKFLTPIFPSSLSWLPRPLLQVAPLTWIFGARPMGQLRSVDRRAMSPHPTVGG